MKIKKLKNFKFQVKFAKYPLVTGVDYRNIILFFGSVLMLLISACFLASISYGLDQVDLSGSSDQIKADAKPEVNTVDPINQAPFSRIIDMNGVVGIDGSLRVLEANYTKVFDLVEISTPVAPGVNHARIFLRADGSKQSLVAEWDDGTFTRLAGN